MATTLPDAPAMSSAGPDEEHVDLVLVERLPAYLRMSAGAACLVAALSILFWRLCTRPLFHTDLWGHLSYGRWIWQHRALPATEPFLPLAQGVPVVDTAWLSQLLGYQIYMNLGTMGLQGLMAASITATVGIIAYHIFQRTGKASIGFLAAATCLSLSIFQFCVGFGPMPTLIRPQIAGILLYTWIFCRAVSPKLRVSDWYLIPLVTCLWANLHGSFVMGPLILMAISVGRGVDVLRRTGKLSLAFRDTRVIRWFLIAELSLVAALVNPYGFSLYTELLNFSSNLNLFDLLDWDPMTLKHGQGRAVAVSALLLVLLYRSSPRRVSVSELLLLVGLGVLALWAMRMLVWWAIPAAYFTALHANAVWNKRLNRKRRFEPEQTEAPRRSGLFSVLAVASVWIGFALSPIGIFALHGKPQLFKTSVSADTPLGALQYLLKQKEPLRGQVFNSYEWGDFLGWAGPPGIKLFVNTHVHLIPREVWQSYQTISMAGNGWDDQLDRYSVNYVIIDPRQLKSLTSQLKSDEKWSKAYEDGISVIFVRKKLI
jgi:hypothetical protein